MTRTQLAQLLSGGGYTRKEYNVIALILNMLSDEQFKKAEKMALKKILGA